MSDETRDPRIDVLSNWFGSERCIAEGGGFVIFDDEFVDLLARLDAADPLRAGRPEFAPEAETRESMAFDYMEGWHGYDPDSPPPTMDEVLSMLRMLDSLDPLRAMWGELVEALDAVVNSHEYNIVAYAKAVEKGRDLLTRALALDATNQEPKT